MKRAFSSDCLANSSELNLRFTCLSSSPCSKAPWVGKGCCYRAWVAMSPFSRWSHATGSRSALSRGLKVGAQCWVGSVSERQWLSRGHHWYLQDAMGTRSLSCQGQGNNCPTGSLEELHLWSQNYAGSVYTPGSLHIFIINRGDTLQHTTLTHQLSHAWVCPFSFFTYRLNLSSSLL